MKILVAEDDAISNRLIQKILTKLGHEVFPARNGLEAWKIFQENEIRMVVTDWMMPEMDGLDLCNKIRSSDKEEYTYIIVQTAKDRTSDLIEMLDVGADDYIIKPFDPEELRARIKNGERIIKLENGYKDLQGILVESRNKLRIVLDSLNEEILAIDDSFRIISVNKTLLNVMGITHSGLEEKPYLKEDGLAFPFEIKEVRSAAAKVFETGTSQFLLNTGTDNHGEKRYREINMLPVKNETGRVFQVVIVAKDITRQREKAEEIRHLNERLREALHQVEAKNEKLEQTLKRLKDTQAQILQSEKMSSIGQLAAGVAHEINNPTGFVSSNLKTLHDYQEDISGLIGEYQKLVKGLMDPANRRGPSSFLLEQTDRIVKEESRIDIDFILEDVLDLIDESREGTERIKKIVLDLKDFAHPGEDELQSADINRNLDSTLNIVWNELKYKATVSKDYGKIPHIYCYPQQLNQVFMNILVNAAQAIESKGEILISTRSLNGQVEIRISDNGPGIPDEDLLKVFDPFFTTKEIGRGTGLGLNVAYNIVEKHKGTIDVESEVGKGTSFIIRIPAVSDA